MVKSAYKPFQKSFSFSAHGITHPVLKDGTGPAVLLMHELPGMGWQFWRLAGWIRDAGFTVYAPDLFAVSASQLTQPSLNKLLIRACISREIHLFAKNSSSPVTRWLRALARQMHEECGGPGVGAIGMCMTGNFALSLVLEEAVIAPVASEPAMPVHFWARKSRGALHLSEDERQALQRRKDIDVLGLRFKGDPTCTQARFAAIESLIGPQRFRKVELEDSAKNPQGNGFPHSVLTIDLLDEDGSPTVQARDQVLSFLKEKLILA